MPRDRLTFRQRDLKAALKAVQDGGLQIARIEVTPDGVVIIPGTRDPKTKIGPDRKTTEAMEHLRRETEKM